jgi:hypothetical protein
MKDIQHRQNIVYICQSLRIVLFQEAAIQLVCDGSKIVDV